MEGHDGKRRTIISRPSSAVSYVRSDHVQQTGYSPSPNPESRIDGSWQNTLGFLTVSEFFHSAYIFVLI